MARRQSELEDEDDGDGITEEDSVMVNSETAVNGTPPRHLRGPGEESDYETPEKPERPAKRSRFDDDPEEIADKRVKWDRSLQETITFDDTPPRPRKPPKGDTLHRKGCLTVSAKVWRFVLSV